MEKLYVLIAGDYKNGKKQNTPHTYCNLTPTNTFLHIECFTSSEDKICFFL